VLPDWSIPFRWSSLEKLSTPDVVHQEVDRAEFPAYSLGQSTDVSRYQVIDRNGDPMPAEAADEIGGLFNRFVPSVVRGDGLDPAGPARADHRRASFAKGGGDASAGASRGTCDDGYAVT
jgi:hypothetical protein